MIKPLCPAGYNPARKPFNRHVQVRAEPDLQADGKGQETARKAGRVGNIILLFWLSSSNWHFLKKTI
jgi:hypothetical protein